MFVVAARYLIKEGNERAVIDILKKMIPLSRAERVQFYAVNQAPDNPRKVLLYEQYADKPGYEAHMATDSFKENTLGKSGADARKPRARLLRNRRVIRSDKAFYLSMIATARTGAAEAPRHLIGRMTMKE